MKKENMENALTEVSDMYLQETVQTEERKKSTHFGKKWIILPAAAAVVTSLMLAVSAIVPVDLGYYLQRAFGEHFGMLEEITSVPDDVVYGTSGDEITMELKGIMGDQQVLVAFVDVTVAAEKALPEDRYYIHFGMEPANKRSSYGCSYGVIGRTENPDGSVTVSCRLSLADSKGVMGSRYVIECNKVEAWDEQIRDYTILAEGEWTAEFTLNYKDMTQIYPVEAEGELLLHDAAILPGKIKDEDLFGVPAKVYEVRISPLSVSVYWKVEAEDKAPIGSNIPSEFSVTLADGTVIKYDRNILFEPVFGRMKLEADGTWHPVSEEEIPAISITRKNSGSSTGGPDAPWYGFCILQFDAELPVDEVVSVNAGGIVVPIE